jgi:DNA-directed RNA polymerase specialized sigma24 family protein
LSREDETEQSPESDASLPVYDGDAVVQGDGHHQHDGTPTAANRSSRFPTTRRSWITRTIARGPEGEQEVARFVMSAYLVPLTAYARSTPGLGDLDPEDLVHDFLLHKVSAPGYFPYWATTNRPLRRWLVSGFHFRLKDRRRKASTERTRTETAAPEIGIEFDEDRFADFERTWARDLVRRAVEQTAEYCRTRQLDEHWTVFQRHHLDGLSFRDLVDAHGLPARRLARMSRTAADRLRMIIQELLARDGVDPDDIAAEITRLLELVR